MPVRIIKESQNVIKIGTAYSIQKTIGLFMISVSILLFTLFILFQPERIDKSFTYKIFNIILILVLLLYLVREFYFFYIDKHRTLTKNGEELKVNKLEFLHSDVSSLLIIEYNGIGIMGNGYNLFIKLKNLKRIPISIRVGKDDMERIKSEMKLFFKVEKLEEKKWWIH